MAWCMVIHKEDFMERRMMAVVCAVALIFGLGFAGTVKVAAGEEPTVDLNSPDVIKSVLEQRKAGEGQIGIGPGIGR